MLCLFIFVLGHYPHHDTCSFSRKIQPKICKNTSYLHGIMPLNLEGFFPSHLPFMAGHCTVAATTQGLLWDPGRRPVKKKQMPGLKHREIPAGDHICCLLKETVYYNIYIYIYIYIHISYNYNVAHYGSKIYWCPQKLNLHLIPNMTNLFCHFAKLILSHSICHGQLIAPWLLISRRIVSVATWKIIHGWPHGNCNISRPC